MSRRSKHSNGRKELEDVKLENDENIVYEAVERPIQGKPAAPPVNNYDSEEEGEISESDSDEDSSSKKPRTAATVCSVGMDCSNDEFRMAARNFQAKKLNSVWNNVHMDDEIAADLTGINVHRSRHVENYPLPPGSQNRKREYNKAKRKRRTPMLKIIEPIDTPEDYNDEELGLEIAKRLSETNKEGIEKVVKMAGRAMALEVFNQTIDMEAIGGMKTQDNFRRRTSGGTFFYLVRCDSRISKKVKRQIAFGSKNVEAIKAGKRRRNQRRNERKRQQAENAENSPEKLPDLPTIAEVFIKSELMEEAGLVDGNGSINGNSSVNGTGSTNGNCATSSSGSVNDNDLAHIVEEDTVGKETAMAQDNGADGGLCIDATFEVDL